MVPLLFSPSPSVVSVLVYPSLYYSVTSQFRSPPSQLFLLSFLWLPSVLLPRMLPFAIYLCRFARKPLHLSPFLSSFSLCHFLGLQASSQFLVSFSLPIIRLFVRL